MINRCKEKYLMLLKSSGGFKALLFALFILTTFFLIQAYSKAFRDYGYDFTSYLISSKAFYAGLNPYQTDTPFPFIYPLFLCVLLKPFTILPYWLSVFLWFLGSFIALFLSAFIFLRLLRPTISTKVMTGLLCFIYFLLFPIISNNFLNGQINFFIVLLCVLFLKYYLEERKIYAGWFLAAAIAIKLTPLIFLIYLIIRRDFSIIFLVLGQIILLSFLLPVLFSGFKVLEYYDYYFQTFLLPKLSGEVADGDGVHFSLMSITRYIGFYVPQLVSFITATLLVLIPIVYLEIKNRRRTTNKNFGQLLLFSLYTLAMLLISPMSETHHLIYLLPSILIIVYAILHLKNDTVTYNFLLLVSIFLFIYFGKMVQIGFLTAILIAYGCISWLLLKHEKALISSSDKQLLI